MLFHLMLFYEFMLANITLIPVMLFYEFMPAKTALIPVLLLFEFMQIYQIITKVHSQEKLSPEQALFGMHISK